MYQTFLVASTVPRSFQQLFENFPEASREPTTNFSQAVINFFPAD